MTTQVKSPLADQMAKMLAKARKENDRIDSAFWGKEHWALLGYVETRCVDNKIRPKTSWAELDRNHMRCDVDRHPQHANSANRSVPSKKYPTRLAEGIELKDHDDYDCLDDLESHGLIIIGGTGMFPTVKMTKLGLEVSSELRAHKASGKNFAEFRRDLPRLPKGQ